jgi:hypothetical protein
MSSDRCSRLRNAGASAAIGLSLMLLSAQAAGPVSIRTTRSPPTRHGL